MPNCLAIFEGLTAALKAARTALNFAGISETDAASTGRLLDVSRAKEACYHVAVALPSLLLAAAQALGH